MVEGISRIIFAVTIRPFPGWAWVLVSGVLEPRASVLAIQQLQSRWPRKRVSEMAVEFDK
jgi:uncharacterized membrane protein HdeD (DUF308 family)